ncbi:ABC transporter ATP-binding protein [Pseudoalteromonas porphyrae]|uniref:ABC transporter ATP-binding protein n=1 Tax=Pseudoalteromonas porphyrae TaxID=187330 RepID=A0A0N1MVS1_9GAMM|nr:MULTISPECIES: ATP-binding cassette domain-containing protein [Pseudoalteromonas]KPH63285.1 ABC transporter ATP-binding protein [Pseudoalteromonas porphyrae]KPH94020.1 ABC transporter ATP-binding protein [Pseudoalteromonas porphyrae]NNG42831.1 ATP-binding cassette domain-containing protein [Pseudoalteromonas sp. NEC-BIFX-2020_002]
MIEVIGLNKQFTTNALYSDYSITFTAPRVCIEAPNGQGKTTLLMMLAGLEGRQSGEFLFSGNTLNDPHNQVAIASDRIALPDFLTAKQIINLSVSALRCDWPSALISGFNFNEFLNTRFDVLSSGNQKKCQLILALMRGAPYLLLDEPSAALDQTSIHYLLTLLDDYLLDKPDGQIIITCHEPEVFIEHGFECMSL